MTSGIAIERKGTTKSMTGVFWINNLEGHTDVHLELDKIGELGKIMKLKNGAFALSPFLGENAK